MCLKCVGKIQVLVKEFVTCLLNIDRGANALEILVCVLSDCEHVTVSPWVSYEGI